MKKAPDDHILVLRMPSFAAELGSPAMRRALAAEALGMLLFVFFAAGTAVMTAGALADRTSAARMLVVAVAHALAFGVAVAGATAFSGGHVNPAITIAAVMAGRMPARRGAMYVVAQLTGAAVAAALLKMLVPGAVANGLGSHAVGTRVTSEAAVLLEMIMTSTLVVAFFLSATSARRELRPVVLGSVVLLAHLFGAGLTGASMNPARTFGPALLSGAWSGHWIYWLGPLMGSALAAVLWRWGWARAEKTDEALMNGDESAYRLARANR
jgi:MIP family channel proteins